MRWIKITLALIVVVLCGRGANAALMQLVGQNIVWNPPVDGATSPALTISVHNTQPVPAPPIPAPERMTGWQLHLMIERVSGTGTLRFQSATAPAANYVFPNSGGLFATPAPPSAGPILFFDYDGSDPPVGVTIDPANDLTLLSMRFSSPDNASGVFRIMAIPGPAATLWSDGVPTDRPFDNLPLDSTAAQLQVGLITIPEPSLSVVTTMLLVSGLRRCRRASPRRA